MATDGNVRYLQYILLLGEGSSLVLQGVANREVRKRQTTLETILNDNKCLLRNHIRDDAQFGRIFTLSGRTNVDMSTWDIALLSKINLHLFGSTLTWGEKASIRFLKDMRNELHAHASSMSLNNDEFQPLWAELSTTLQTLTAGLPQDTQDKCQGLITELAKGLGSLESTEKKIKTLAQYDEQFQKALDLVIGELHSGLCQVGDKIEEGFIVIQEEMVKSKENIEDKIHRTSQKLHEHVEQSSLTMKEVIETKALECQGALKQLHGDAIQRTNVLGEGISDANQRLKSVQHEVLDVQENVGAVGEKVDETRQILTKNIAEMKEGVKRQMERQMKELYDKIESLMSEGREFKSPQVVGAEVNVEGPDDDVTSQAEEQLLKEFEKAKALVSAVAKRAKQSDDQTAIDELEKVVREVMERIESIEDVQTGSIHKHCILLNIKCTSVAGMLELLQTLGSRSVQEHLNEIAKVLTSHYGGEFRLTARAVPESVEKAIEHLYTDEPKRRTISLPIRCDTLAGLAQVYDFVTAEETTKCLDDMASALTRRLGKKIKVEASLNIAQCNEALANTEVTGTTVKDVNVAKETHELKSVQTTAGSQAAEGVTPSYGSNVLKSYRKINVRMTDDKNVCSIYGCCALPDGSFLLADYSNKKLKRLNKAYEIVDHCILSAKPWDVCYAGDGEAAVSLRDNSVQFVNVDGKMTVKRTMKCSHSCWGITSAADRLYIKGGNSVIRYARSGEDKEVIHTVHSLQTSYQHVEANDEGSKIYLSGDADSFQAVVLDIDGNEIGKCEDATEKGASDICIDGDGNLYFCSVKGKYILQVDSNSLEKVASIVSASDEVSCPWCICFDRNRSAIIVGHLRDDEITIVDLRA